MMIFLCSVYVQQAELSGNVDDDRAYIGPMAKEGKKKRKSFAGFYFWI